MDWCPCIALVVSLNLICRSCFFISLLFNLQIRNLWSKEEPIPRIPLDEQPDLNCCLLYQQLQVINCCIARKKRRDIASESLEAARKESERLEKEGKPLEGKIYAKTVDGEYVLRLGVSSISQNLTMLETGEAVYSPVMQVCDDFCFS